MTIKAIPTRYAGCHFRSRLEARWAVVLDHANIWKWEYEPEGFVLPGGLYLPDFRLSFDDWPDLWLEVKGVFPTVRELDLMKDLVAETGLQGVIMFGDLPRDNNTINSVLVGPTPDQLDLIHAPLPDAYAAGRSARFEHGQSGAT